MSHPNNNGHLHFETILNSQNIGCIKEPCGIKTEWINAFIPSVGELWSIGICGIQRINEINTCIVWCKTLSCNTLWPEIPRSIVLIPKVTDFIARAEPVVRNSEPLIVQKTIIAWENAHQTEHISESLHFTHRFDICDNPVVEEHHRSTHKQN